MCPGASTSREPGSTRDSYTECVSQLLRGKGAFVYTYVCATNAPSPFISQSPPWVKLLVLLVLAWVQNISACIHFCSWPHCIEVRLYRKDSSASLLAGPWGHGGAAALLPDSAGPNTFLLQSTQCAIHPSITSPRGKKKGNVLAGHQTFISTVCGSGAYRQPNQTHQFCTPRKIKT